MGRLLAPERVGGAGGRPESQLSASTGPPATGEEETLEQMVLS